MMGSDVHVGYYIRHVFDERRLMLVGQGPLDQVMPLTHTGSGFSMFANLKAPFVEEPSEVSRVARDPHTNTLVESFSRPVDINSVVGWLLMAADGYIRTCATEILQASLIPYGEARDLWFEVDRESGRLVRGPDSGAGRRMEQAWTEPWPDHLVIVHFKGAMSTLQMTTHDCGAGGWGDLDGTDIGRGGEWPYKQVVSV